MSSDIIRMVVDDLNTAIVIFSSIPLKQFSPEITFTNLALQNITGYSETEFGEILVSGLFCDQTDAKISLSFEHDLREGNPVKDVELLLKKKDGTQFWGMMSFVKADGYGDAWVMVMRDISERKMAEEKLERDKQRLAVTLRSIGDGVITVDTTGKVEFMNRQAEDVLGYRYSDALSKPLNQIFYLVEEGSKEPLDDPLVKIFRTGKSVELSTEALLLTSRGEERKIRGNVSPIIDAQGRLMGGVLAFSDVTERLKLEQELQKGQRMESIALLTSGIAHDFNNILTGILGNISLASRHCEESSPLNSFLGAAEKASVRAKDLTYQLLTFSKGGVPVKAKASIKHLLNEAANFILSGSNCRLVENLEDDLWPVVVDEGQIIQVVHNLLINAIHAMPNGGVLTVSAENIEVGGEVSLPLAPGAFSKISVQDTGSGISVDNLTRIFDPYFTTKQSGTGLGLATSYTIIKNHGGHIEVESELGEGTTFTLYLPALLGEVESEEKVELKIFRGEGRILVMDDEQMIQQIVGDMLMHLGYEVAFAQNGDEAIAKFEEATHAGQPFDAMILDMTVPGGKGAKEVLEILSKNHSDLKAVLSSGYIDDHLVKNYRDYGFRGTISKPFNVQQISWIVKSVIDDEDRARH